MDALVNYRDLLYDDDDCFVPLYKYLLQQLLESEGIGNIDEIDEQVIYYTMEQYSYIGHSRDDVYFYKHFGTREYIQILVDGLTHSLIHGEIEDYRDWEV